MQNCGMERSTGMPLLLYYTLLAHHTKQQSTAEPLHLDLLRNGTMLYHTVKILDFIKLNYTSLHFSIHYFCTVLRCGTVPFMEGSEAGWPPVLHCSIWKIYCAMYDAAQEFTVLRHSTAQNDTTLHNAITLLYSKSLLKYLVIQSLLDYTILYYTISIPYLSTILHHTHAVARYGTDHWRALTSDLVWRHRDRVSSCAKLFCNIHFSYFCTTPHYTRALQRHSAVQQ